MLRRARYRAPAGIEFDRLVRAGSGLFDGIAVVWQAPEPEGVGGSGRKVQAATVGLRARNCIVNVSISRAPGEEHTYITLLFDQWPTEPDRD